MSKPYGTWTLPELKAELRQRNARTSGRKADLVERLEFYDRHSMLGASDANQPEFHMTLPEEKLYKDLHAGLIVPALQMTQVELYLASRDKQMDKKATNLYNNSYVNFIRCCDDAAGTFFKAEVRAEMKASVVYKVDICLSPDCVILQCQCECAVGMGPHAHCKHVNCVLLGLTEFTASKEFKSLATCTQQLQTFHQAKKHLGSPVKAQKLNLHVSENIDFDPRPPAYRARQGYADFFKSAVLNEQVFSTAPVMHILPPANPYALNNDHDYFEMPAADHFLVTDGLVSINELQAQSIELDSRDDRSLWKSERQKRICSSSFGTVCKLTDRADKGKLAKRLVSGKEFRSAATAHGRTYEPVAVRRYEERTGCKTQACGLFVAKNHSFLGSTPDRIVSETILLEVKCPYTAKDKMVSVQTVPYLCVGEDGGFQLKQNHDYFFQVQGQMFCVGPHVQEVHFCVYTFVDFQIIRVGRDDEFISDMVHKLKMFHENVHKDAVLDKLFLKATGSISWLEKICMYMYTMRTHKTALPEHVADWGYFLLLPTDLSLCDE